MGDHRQGSTVVKLVFLLTLLSLVLVLVATGVPSWSEKDGRKYGLWTFCITDYTRYQEFNVLPELCGKVQHQGECAGLHNSAGAFSILGIIFIGLTMFVAALLARQRKMKGAKLTCTAWALCILSMFAFLFSLLCWVFWLAYAESICDGRPKLRSYGASFVLQVIASGMMLFNSLIACTSAYMLATNPLHIHMNRHGQHEGERQSNYAASPARQEYSTRDSRAERVQSAPNGPSSRPSSPQSAGTRRDSTGRSQQYQVPTQPTYAPVGYKSAYAAPMSAAPMTNYAPAVTTPTYSASIGAGQPMQTYWQQ
uniref:Uncharacterized protein n=1 Tax=Eutreptiella gymnastica TaxID=73025 RepID=A0A7S1N6K8_9EUGL|mmetsp:Transcript_125214/g.216999  ORF Transcript_125214/g.216999 Transcript_125214/m.216999 type:complete len:310 (+) Transcript_125214:68-997(+)